MKDARRILNKLLDRLLAFVQGWKADRLPSHGNVSTVGNGKVSVPVMDILNSPKVRRQVDAVAMLAAANKGEG